MVKLRYFERRKRFISMNTLIINENINNIFSTAAESKSKCPVKHRNTTILLPVHFGLRRRDILLTIHFTNERNKSLACIL